MKKVGWKGGGLLLLWDIIPRACIRLPSIPLATDTTNESQEGSMKVTGKGKGKGSKREYTISVYSLTTIVLAFVISTLI